MSPPVKVLEAEFWAAAEPGRSLPPAEAPEVAFGGRSNVGKSSLLGALTGRSKLVRVSKAPGRTRAVNVFQLRTDRGRVAFSDLPGYGYARVSRETGETWGPLVEDYLSRREGLRALVAIVDLRRGVEEDDLQLLDYASALDLEVLVVATKADKVAKACRKPALAAVQRASGRAARIASAVTREGLDDVWRWIAARCLDQDPRPDDPRAARRRRST